MPLQGQEVPVTQQMPRNLQLTREQDCPTPRPPSFTLQPAYSPPTQIIPPDRGSDPPPIHPPERPPTDRKGRKKCPEKFEAPIADLEKKLRPKAVGLTGQYNTRYQAALRFLYFQKLCQNKTRQTMALNVVKCFNRGR